MCRTCSHGFKWLLRSLRQMVSIVSRLLDMFHSMIISSATMGQVFSERYQGKGEVVLFLGCRHIAMSTIKNCLLDRKNASAKTLAFESLYGGKCSVSTPNYLFFVSPPPPPMEHSRFFRSLTPPFWSHRWDWYKVTENSHNDWVRISLPRRSSQWFVTRSCVEQEGVTNH